jgi:hypothetical protein
VNGTCASRWLPCLSRRETSGQRSFLHSAPQPVQDVAQEPGDLHLAHAELERDLGLGQPLTDAQAQQPPVLVGEAPDRAGEIEQLLGAVEAGLAEYRDDVGRPALPWVIG